MKVGDKLYCIEDNFYNSEYFALKGQIFEIVELPKPNECRITCIDLKGKVIIGMGGGISSWYYKEDGVKRDASVEYLWMCFESKVRRAKRIINGNRSR